MESGITQSTLANMFERKTCTKIDTLNQICQAFGISLAEFFNEECNSLIVSKEEKKLVREYRILSKDEKRAVKELVHILSTKNK